MEQFGDGNYPLQSIGGMSDVVTKGTTPTTLGFEFVSAGVRFVKAENITATGQILKDELIRIVLSCFGVREPMATGVHTLFAIYTSKCSPLPEWMKAFAFMI